MQPCLQMKSPSLRCTALAGACINPSSPACLPRSLSRRGRVVTRDVSVRVQPGSSMRRRDVGLCGMVSVVGSGLFLLPAQAAEAPEADDGAPRFYKTDSGIKVQELVVGTGPQPKIGDVVLIDYVLRRSNGYFIYSTREGVSFQPKEVPVGPVAFKYGQDPEWIQGIQELVGQMRKGGKIRALIPPGDLGYQNCSANQPQPPTFATKRQLVNHCQEPLLFELALLRVTPSS